MNTIKKAILFYLSLAILFYLCGCSVSGKNIAKEISALDPYFIRYGLELTEYEVTKRQTNNEDKTDFVWLDIKGENDDFTYSASYELIYIKYNEGWLLEGYDVTFSNYYVKSKPTAIDIEKDLSGGYDNITVISTNTDHLNNTSTVLCTGTKSTKLIKETYKFSLDYAFSPETGWKKVGPSISLEDSSYIIDTYYDVLGEWLYTDETHTYYIHIKEAKNNTITFKYVFLNKQFCEEDEFRTFLCSDYQIYEMGLYSDEYIPTNQEYYLDISLPKLYKTPHFRDDDYVWFMDGEISGMYFNGCLLERISENNNTTSIPEELVAAQADYAIDYTKIPSRLFDSTIINQLDNLNRTYSELGLTTGKASDTSGQRYPIGKSNFLGKEANLFLYCIPEGNRYPSSITIKEYISNEEERLARINKIRESFESNGLEVYEKYPTSFVAKIPNSDLIVSVFDSLSELWISIEKP